VPFELRTAAGEVALELDVDHRLVQAINIGPARYAVPFHDEFAVVTVEFRDPGDLEFDGEFKDELEDRRQDIVDIRESLGQLEAPASKTEAEREEELKKEVGMKVRK
jgi:hypothetical protein